MTRNIGFILLAIWLIISGLMLLIPGLQSRALEIGVAILGIFSGVFILLQK